jgi:hypothetical protein
MSCSPVGQDGILADCLQLDRLRACGIEGYMVVQRGLGRSIVRLATCSVDSRFRGG